MISEHMQCQFPTGLFKGEGEGDAKVVQQADDRDRGARLLEGAKMPPCLFGKRRVFPYFQNCSENHQMHGGCVLQTGGGNATPRGLLAEQQTLFHLLQAVSEQRPGALRSWAHIPRTVGCMEAGASCPCGLSITG